MAACLAASACACATGPAPENKTSTLYMKEKEDPSKEPAASDGYDAACPAAGAPDFIMEATPGPRIKPPGGVRYSPGDRLNIKVFDGDDFSGDYVVGADGAVHVPLVGEVRAAGLTNAQLQARLAAALLRADLFRKETLRLSVRPIQYAPINFSVSGATFRPGRILINQIQASDKTEAQLKRFGDNPLERSVIAALRSAGGVRPDADVSAIELVRAGKRYRLDLRGVFTGAPVDEVTLVAGDHIHVPSSPCFQSGLVRPSLITPDGLRVMFSNHVPSAIMTGAAGIGLPYGARFLQALAAGNCIGGALSTTARRSAILISRNLRTGATEIVQRSVEDLVRSGDRDTFNPFLMPDDSIACYDSEVTNIREILSVLSLGVATTLSGTSLGR